MGFSAAAAGTASTFQSPDTTYSGDPFATFLTGAVQGSASYSPIMFTRDNEWAVFFQDDIKVSPKLTLNVGLRDEWEPGI